MLVAWEGVVRVVDSRSVARRADQQYAELAVQVSLTNKPMLPAP